MNEKHITLGIVSEACNVCGHDIELLWDVEMMGYKAYCPVCGATLMLCDMCQHRNPEDKYMDDCDYDPKTDTCRFNQEGT